MEVIPLEIVESFFRDMYAREMNLKKFGRTAIT
jgi:hypothetical protein